MSRSNPIASNDPNALEKLQAELATCEADQATMTRINKAIQSLIKKPRKAKNAPPEKVGFQIGNIDAQNAAFRAKQDARKAQQAHYPTLAPALAELAGITEAQALKLLTPDYMGRIGFHSWQLTNNNANIHRLKERIASVTALQAKTIEAESSPEANADIVTHGVTVRHDYADNRLRLLFPGKPDSLTITQLKQHGFKWSPTNGAWQRFISNAADYAADYVLTSYASRLAE